MQTTKTYQSKKIELHLTYREQALSPSQLKKLAKGFKLTLAVLETHLKSYRAIKRFELNVSLIGDAAMKKINFKHRGKDSTTDVLSFPMEDDLRKMTKAKMPHLLLGDIVISKPVTIKQAKQFSISFEREFLHLLVHGFLHLQGYDHERSEAEEKIMFGLEEKLLKQIVVQFPNL
jgi:probable rRNA maturation factor